MPVVTDYTALLSGSSWSGIEVTGKPAIVTYSFPTSAASYLSGVGGFTAATIASFEAFTTAQQTQARAALGEWAAASGLVFLEVAPGKGDLNFQLVDFDTTSGPSYAGAGGVAFYPFGDWNFFTYPYFSGDLDSSGDVVMNTRFVSGGEVTYGTLLHEIGHAIGLKHPTEIVTNFAADPDVLHDEVLSADDPALTIMATIGEGNGGPDHLRQLDQDAAAFLYGPAGTGGVHTGDASGANAAVSAWLWNAATATLTQTGFVGADAIRGSSVKDVIDGVDGADRLFGLAGDDTLTGGDGDDLLHGGAGGDRMTGGIGDDDYFVDSARDSVIEAVDGGYDEVYATVSHALAANVERLTLYGAGLVGRGNDLANVIYGDFQNAGRAYGYAGADYLTGGIANDVLDGGTGADGMAGFGGSDTYFVDDAGDAIFEDAAGGTDRVMSTATVTLAVNVEDLILTGTAAIDGTGNAAANKLNGNNGANTLLGLGGADTLTGGAAVDTMDGGEDGDTYFATQIDLLNDTGTTGTDRVIATSSYTLADDNGIEAITAMEGRAVATLTGNNLANSLVGNSGDNFLRGMAGNDTLDAGAGIDRLEGGTGRDTMTGGTQADTFLFKAGDTLANATGFDTIADFLTTVDKIDLDIIGGGGLALAQYGEVALASTNFPALLAAAQSEMSSNGRRVAFVAGSADGWLFWSTNGLDGTAEAAVRLTLQNTLASFAHGDLM